MFYHPVLLIYHPLESHFIPGTRLIGSDPDNDRLEGGEYGFLAAYSELALPRSECTLALPTLTDSTFGMRILRIFLS